MGTISVNRLAGLSLIFGPIIAFVFFLIEPGGLIIDSAKVSDAVGSITAKGSNAALTNVTNIGIILGLAIILSGLYALMRNVTLQGNGKAFVQMGFFMVFVGLTGWILSTGIDFILADAQTSDQIRGSVPVYYAGSALVYAGGIVLGFGGFIFALGLSTRDDFNRIVSLLAALVSLAVMVFFMIAVLYNDGRDTFITLARGFYVLLVIWYGYLGVVLMNRPDPDLCNRQNPGLAGRRPESTRRRLPTLVRGASQYIKKLSQNTRPGLLSLDGRRLR